MRYYEQTIGEGSPRVALIAGVHGDETLGVRALDELRILQPKRGTVSLIVAHPEAVKRQRRFIQFDLNRSFPGEENGLAERGLAHALHQRLQEFDYIIDIHATHADIPAVAIATRLNQSTKDLLATIPIASVVLARESIFGGHELITQFPAAVSLDYGPDKHDGRYQEVVDHLHAILQNLGVFDGPRRLHRTKEIYETTEQFLVSADFKSEPKLQELVRINAGDVLGSENGKIVTAPFGFYPLFLRRGKYNGTLCLVARTRRRIEV